MCCLFGMIDCECTFTGKQKARVIRALATSAEARGTDASGIAYNLHGRLHICKRPLPGHQLPLRIPDDAAVIMGHTRMTTQGNEKRNYNNHPFPGQAGNTAFALAHNGVLHNDRALRKSLKLPRTKIETDSYVAAQLIEHERALSFDSLKYMAEKVEGSFAFTVLDARDNLYFVKGDNPLCICHYPERKLYLYASTEAILMNALLHIPYALGEAARVNLDGGELLMIDPDGGQMRSTFQYDEPMAFCEFGYYGWPCRRTWGQERDSYIMNLKSVAGAYGFSPGQIDRLLDAGFEPEEIEECLCC